MTRILLWLSISALAACNDPVRNTAIDELGAEAKGVPAGPLHRPGQPCLACHGGEGPADSEFAFAGTLYQRPSDDRPLHDARVHVIDSLGAEYTVVSNCAGNFWAGAENYRPVWPAWVKVEYQGDAVEMTSAIFRDGSCGACHGDRATPNDAGHVYFADSAARFTQEPCR